MKFFLYLVLIIFTTSTLFAGGYRVSLQGQRQLAMGHTGVAVVNNAEVLFFNPAGMAFLEDKFNASAGGNVLVANTKFQNETYNWSRSTRNVGTPFSVYASYRFTDWFTAGIAVYTPYGSAVKWDTDWEGSHLVNNIDLQAIYVQPTVSIKVNDKFSVGGGFILVSGGVNFNRNLTRSLTNEQGLRSNVTIDAQGVTATGYTAGFMFNPTDQMRLGFNYRSKIIMKARGGDATFNNIPAFLQSTFGNTTFDADLPLPAEIAVGLSYSFLEKWLVAFDYNRTQWRVYKSLDVHFNNAVPSSINPRNYKDSNTYRFGVQYIANNKFVFRAGFYIDESPVRDGYFAPETPRNDSMGYTGGLTFQVTKNLGIDASFLYLHFDEIDNSYDHYLESGVPVSFGGTYKSSVFSPGLGLTYSF